MSNIIKIALLFILAILVALIVRTVVASASHPKAAVVDAQKVRVAAADLPQGLLLRDDDLAWKEVPNGQVPPNAILSDAPNAPDLKGALLRHPTTSGTPLTSDDVILPNAPGFLAATLKPDMRAVSVAIDDVSGNAGLIQPGDYVDLLLTQSMDKRTDAPDLAVSSETVVQHVRVLAVGSEISRPKANGNGPDANVQARTVTLEVTPRMGEAVAVAARLGSLSLALRSFAKTSRDADAAASETLAASASAPVWAGDISRAVRELPHAQHTAPTVGPATAAAAPAPRTVIIYRGSDKVDTSGGMTADAGPVGSGAPPLPAGPANPQPQ